MSSFPLFKYSAHCNHQLTSSFTLKLCRPSTIFIQSVVSCTLWNHVNSMVWCEFLKSTLNHKPVCSVYLQTHTSLINLKNNFTWAGFINFISTRSLYMLHCASIPHKITSYTLLLDGTLLRNNGTTKQSTNSCNYWSGCFLSCFFFFYVQYVSLLELHASNA